MTHYDIASIKTEYKGVVYRSKLESVWAELLVVDMATPAPHERFEQMTPVVATRFKKDVPILLARLRTNNFKTFSVIKVKSSSYKFDKVKKDGV